MTRPRNWTEAESAHLIKHYAHHTAGDIAKHLGLKEKQVYARAKTLGLTKAVKRDPVKSSGITIEHGVGYRIITHIQRS